MPTATAATITAAMQASRKIFMTVHPNGLNERLCKVLQPEMRNLLPLVGSAQVGMLAERAAWWSYSAAVAAG